MYQVFRPYITDAEIKAVTEVLRSRWIGLGPKTAEFETAFAKYLGMAHCVMLNSCTAALDIALKLCKISAGDKVLVPTMTFVSTAHAVCYQGAIPVFVDCDDDLQMDLTDLMRKVDSRVRAIIVVHYGGRVNQWVHEIIDFCKKHNIWLIEDCAHAAGAMFNERPAGTFGDIGCFSFHAVKNLAAGDGGAIITNDRRFASRAKRLRWLGIDKGTWDRTADNKEYWWEYKVDEIGYKCHPNDILSAIGLEQLKRLDDANDKRRQIYEWYQQGLYDIPQVQLAPHDTNESQSAWHILWIKAMQRDRLSVYLKENGVNTGVHYKPIHLYGCYGNMPSLPNAEGLFKKILSLPMYPELEAKDIGFICGKIKAFYED